jgi:hypothetical protein
LPLPSELAINQLPTILPTIVLSSPSLTGTVAEVVTGPVCCGMIAREPAESRKARQPPGDNAMRSLDR